MCVRVLVVRSFGESKAVQPILNAFPIDCAFVWRVILVREVVRSCGRGWFYCLMLAITLARSFPRRS